MAATASQFSCVDLEPSGRLCYTVAVFYSTHFVSLRLGTLETRRVLVTAQFRESVNASHLASSRLPYLADQ